MPFRVVPFRDRLLNRLIKRAELVAVERDEPVFHAGAEATHVVLLRDGHLRLEAAADGGEGDVPGRVVDVVLPWEVTGTAALLPGGVHLWTAVAGGPARLHRLEGRAVRRVLRRAEGTFDAFWAASTARLALAREMGPGTSGTLASRRLALLLVHLAGRATDRPSGPLELPVRLTHRVLGEMAGLHRSTVTTLLNDWIYRDLLETLEPGWRIPDPGALLDTS